MGFVRLFVSWGLAPLSTIAVPVGATAGAPVRVTWTGCGVAEVLTSFSVIVPLLRSRVTLSESSALPLRGEGRMQCEYRIVGRGLLRGNAFHSHDAGMTWEKSHTGISTGITAGTALADGRIVLVSQGGQILVSRDDARKFVPVAVASPVPLYGVAPAGAQQVATVGARGVRLDRLE